MMRANLVYSPQCHLPSGTKAEFALLKFLDGKKLYLNAQKAIGVRRLDSKTRSVNASRADTVKCMTPGLNPFSGKEKKDAAYKALEDAFSGKKDILADLDAPSTDTGGDGGSGKKKSKYYRGDGGGGSGGEGGADWRDEFKKWGEGFGKNLAALGNTLKAILLFVGVMIGLTFLGPLFSMVIQFIRVFLRLDKAEDVYGVKEKQAPGIERSVLFDEDVKNQKQKKA